MSYELWGKRNVFGDATFRRVGLLVGSTGARKKNMYTYRHSAVDQ